MPNPIYDIGYRYATQRYTLDGSTIDFEFNFDGGYISQDYVKAFWKKPDLSEEEIDRSDITFVGPNQLRIPIAAEQNTAWKLIIRRDTPKNIPLVDFTDGSILNERNLDKNTKQAIHGIAELVDFIADLLQEWRELYAIVYDFLNYVEIFETQIENINTLINEIQEDIDALNDRIDNLKFTDLVDTPNSYTGQANKVSAVSDTEDGLVFKTIAEVITEEGLELGLEDAPNDRKKYVRGSNKFGPLEPNEWTLFNIREAEDFSVGGKARFSTLQTDQLSKITEVPVASAFNICGTPSRSGSGPWTFNIYIQRGYYNIEGVSTLCPTNNIGFYGTSNDYSYVLACEVITSSYATLAEMMNKTFYIGISKTTGESIFTETELSTEEYYVLYKCKSMTSQAFLSEFIDMRLLNIPESTGGGSVGTINNLLAQDDATTTGLTWGFHGGRYIDDYTGDYFDIEDGTVTLNDDATNYIALWATDDLNSVIVQVYNDIADLQSSDTLIATIVTESGEITSYTDERIPFAKKQRRAVMPFNADDYNSYDHLLDVFGSGKEGHGSILRTVTEEEGHNLSQFNIHTSAFDIHKVNGCTYSDLDPQIVIQRAYLNINNSLTLCPVLGGDEGGTWTDGLGSNYIYYEGFSADGTYYFSINKSNGHLEVDTSLPSVKSNLLLYSIPIVSGKIDYNSMQDYRSTWTSINAQESSAFANKEVITVVFDNGLSDVEVDSKFEVLVPWDCNIVKWATLSDDTTGEIILDILKETNHIATTAYNKFDQSVVSTYASIVGTYGPNVNGYAGVFESLTGKEQDSTLAGWNGSVLPVPLKADTLLRFKVTSCTGVKKLTLFLTVEKT